MDVLFLLRLSESELKDWTAEQSPSVLRQTFDLIWARIRGARLSAGQPRSTVSASSVELARKASVIADISGNPVLQLQSWRMLSYSLTANEQYEDAIPYYRQVIPGLERIGDFEQAARARVGFVAALYQSGMYDEALGVAEIAERWFKDNKDEAGYARLCTNIANLHHRLDQHAKAHRYYMLAYETFANAGDQQAVAQVSLNLGNTLSSMDQFQQSDEMYEKSERLSLDLGLKDLWAQAAYNRAYLFYQRGRYGDALQRFGRLRTLFQKSGSDRHYALCDLAEAEIYIHLHFFRDASSLARRAADRFKTLDLQYEYAKSLAAEGVALMQSRRFTDALDTFRLAQEGFEKEGNVYRVTVLDLYRAEAYLSLKTLEEAGFFAERAKTQFGKMEIPSKRIHSLVVLGRVSLELGNIDAAAACALEISAISRETSVPLLLFPYYILRGDIAVRKQEWSDAEHFYQTAAHDLELHQRQLHHDDLRVTFFTGRNRAYEEVVGLKLRNDRFPESVTDAYSWCERAKSRGLVELLSHHFPELQAQAESPLLEKINRLREELNMLYARSQQEVRPISSLSNFDTVAAKEDELSRSLREMSRVDPEYASLQEVSTATVESIQEILSEETTLIEYFVIHGEVLAFILTRSGASVEKSLCPVSHVEEVQQRLGFQLEKCLLGKQFQQGHDSQIAAATQYYLQDLYRSLLSRLRQHLRTKRLTIVPHGPLHGLPFHAFHDGNKHLIDDFEISYAPSASVLKYCLEKPDITGGSPVLIGVADEYAPFVEDEVRRIAQLFPDACLLVNQAASRRDFVDAAEGASFLHIATHAIFRNDNPMFSGFKLSDGWMTALDLFSMSCQTNLVTLSGCKSGMSEVAGSDDLLGLMRGFLYAGARSLLVSLWNVDDEITSQLMSLFYDSWRHGTTKSAALSHAMRTVRSAYPNPFYWAPFLLIGKS